jgi:hypothetical protein
MQFDARWRVDAHEQQHMLIDSSHRLATALSEQRDHDRATDTQLP